MRSMIACRNPSAQSAAISVPPRAVQKMGSNVGTERARSSCAAVTVNFPIRPPPFKMLGGKTQRDVLSLRAQAPQQVCCKPPRARERLLSFGAHFLT
jgi:hypothetical protein